MRFGYCRTASQYPVTGGGNTARQYPNRTAVRKAVLEEESTGIAMQQNVPQVRSRPTAGRTVETR
jgi:hypothetical protein